MKPTLFRPGPLLAALMLAAATGGSAQAQALPTISVGRIGSDKTCSLYEMSEGKSAVAVNRYAAAAVSSWRTWLVRDCVDNFASIRTSMEAALAASGKFVVKPSGGAYVVTGRISDVSGVDSAPPATPSPGEGGFAISSSSMFVNMDVALRDSAGRAIHGGLFTKRLETGSRMEVDGFRTTSSQSGQALYGELQHEVALTAARLVAFHITPLTVIGGGGRQIRLNYGTPLLKLGTIVMATSPDGGATVRYNVTSAGQGAATAEVDGDGDSGRIVPGSRAVVIEADDPAANGRRMRRVDLP